MVTSRALLVALLLCSAAVARADDDQDAARLHFQVGQAYYDEANYTDALKEFREAYRLSKRPALLYNIGLCHEHLDQYEEAIAALERYLREQPTSGDRSIIEQRIANLRRRVAHTRPPEAKLPPARPVEPTPRVASPPVTPPAPAPTVAALSPSGSVSPP